MRGGGKKRRLLDMYKGFCEKDGIEQLKQLIVPSELLVVLWDVQDAILFRRLEAVRKVYGKVSAKSLLALSKQRLYIVSLGVKHFGRHVCTPVHE